jgi:chitosanase
MELFGMKDLDANVHPYVVFGNEDHTPSFMPDEHGMEQLSDGNCVR